MKQKELAEKYGVTPSEIGKIRKKVCSDEDYCTKTRELSNFGVSKIERYFKERDNSIIEPKFVKVQALRQTPNKLFWYCKLFEKPVRKVTVAIPATHADSIRPLMVFKAQEIERSNEKFYRHEIIHKRELQREQRIKEIYK